jgi:glutaredoxin-related protein
MSFVKLKNVTNLFEDANNTSIGIPTAISASGNRFLAVGTSMGNIVVF